MALPGAAAVSMRSGVGDLPRLRHRTSRRGIPGIQAEW